MQDLFDIMTLIREKILEKLIIPGLDISWWKFSIYLLIIGVVVTVLINGVRISSGKAAGDRYQDERFAKHQQRRSRGK